MAWFRKTDGQTPPHVLEWDVPSLTNFVLAEAPTWEQRDVDKALIEARLADNYRDENLSPVLPARFAQMVSGFDANDWRRLALAVSALELPEIRSVLPALAIKESVERQVKQGFVRLASETTVLTLALLGQSAVRAEEFCRHFAAYLGVAIRGESPQVSANMLARLDYRRLLAEVERAKLSAHEQLDYLRKLQEAQENLRGRGKA